VEQEQIVEVERRLVLEAGEVEVRVVEGNDAAAVIVRRIEIRVETDPRPKAPVRRVVERDHVHATVKAADHVGDVPIGYQHERHGCQSVGAVDIAELSGEEACVIDPVRGRRSGHGGRRRRADIGRHRSR